MRLWTKTTWVPIDRCINKALQPVAQSAEYQQAMAMVGSRAHTGLPYYLARTGRVDWGQVMFGDQCPTDFRYWVSPWCDKARPPMTQPEIQQRTLLLPNLTANFRQIILACQDKWIGSAVDAIELLRYDGVQRFIYLDGNHRVAASYLWVRRTIPVKIRGRFRQGERVWSKEPDQTWYMMSDHTVQLWWDTAWRYYNDGGKT